VLTKNCNREADSLRRTAERGRQDEGYAKYQENEEELERIKVKKKVMKRRE
jgi:hypothetical protein